MIAKLLGITVDDGPERESEEDSGEGIRNDHRVRDPPTKLEEQARMKRLTMIPTAMIGLAVIGMMMVAVSALLLLPINLSMEHARIILGLGFFVVGVSAIFDAATRARSPRFGT
jgi:hypothetical protein